MRKLLLLLSAVALLAAACGSSGAGDERVVLVDFSHDAFATFAAQNFPNKLAVTPGQTIVFKQTWTGEAHTVTGGRKIDATLSSVTDWFAFFDGYTALAEKNPKMVNPDEPDPAATWPQFMAALNAAKPAAESKQVIDAWHKLQASHPDLPSMENPPDLLFSVVNAQIDSESNAAFDALVFASDHKGGLNQNVGQRCFLRTGAPPEDENTPCTKAQQRQPVFDGTYDFYNSGVIPYDGPQGNTYRVKLSPKTKPGTYFFYCAIHGPGQRVQVEVRKPGSAVPSASAVAREASKQTKALVLPLEKTYQTAVRDNKVNLQGHTVRGPFAGLQSGQETSINEFIPRTLHAKAGEPITWKLMGADHTISFDVPAYLPIIEFRAAGIRLNPKVRVPAGGAPTPPEASPDEHGPRKIDGGTYKGAGFWSSGLVGGDPYAEYTLRVAKPGTYDYACLVHPKMVGKLIVT